MEDEDLARGVDPVDDAARRAARIDVPGSVDGEGGDVPFDVVQHDFRLARAVDAMDLARGSGGHEQAPLRIEGEGPEVLVVGVEEDRRLSRAVEEVHLAVGRRAGEETAVVAEGKGVDLELGRVVDGGGGARAFDAQHPALVAGSGVDPPLGITRQRPHRRRLGIVERPGRGGEADPALGVDGEPLRVALQEVARALHLPELRLGRGRRGGRAQHGQGNGETTEHGASQEINARR